MVSNSSDGTIDNNEVRINTPVVEDRAVNLAVSVADGGQPFVALPGDEVWNGSASSGAWSVMVRNTGTSASSGTTTVQFGASATGRTRPPSGTGWSCSDNNTSTQETCTNDAVVDAGGALPPLTFPWASLPNYGSAYADVMVSNSSDGTIDNNEVRINTPVVEDRAVNLAVSVADGGQPFVA